MLDKANKDAKATEVPGGLQDKVRFVEVEQDLAAKNRRQTIAGLDKFHPDDERRRSDVDSARETWIG